MGERPMMVVSQHAIGYPEMTWAEVAQHCKRIGVTLHADSIALPLWSMQELFVMDAAHDAYLLELRLGSLSRMKHSWQDNWIEMLIERCATYRTRIRWYGKEMSRAHTYESWLVHGTVGLVVIADKGSTYHQPLVTAAHAADIPCFRIDPDSHQAYQVKRQTKEKDHG